MNLGGTLLISSDPDDAVSQREKVFLNIYLYTFVFVNEHARAFVSNAQVYPCSLQDRGVRNGARLECDDFLQKFQFVLIIKHR